MLDSTKYSYDIDLMLYIIAADISIIKETRFKVTKYVCTITACMPKLYGHVRYSHYIHLVLVYIAIGATAATQLVEGAVVISQIKNSKLFK